MDDKKTIKALIIIILLMASTFVVYVYVNRDPSTKTVKDNDKKIKDLENEKTQIKKDAPYDSLYIDSLKKEKDREEMQSDSIIQHLKTNQDENNNETTSYLSANDSIRLGIFSRLSSESSYYKRH